jgi:hypothetical protein
VSSEAAFGKDSVKKIIDFCERLNNYQTIIEHRNCGRYAVANPGFGAV